METIGEKLHQARIERGLTIGDLQKITKIQRRYLEAIEADDLDAMPSDYYKRTFIRQFAEAVGLNPRPLLRRLDGKPEYEDLSTTTALSLPVKGSRKTKYNEVNNKKSLVATYIPVALLIIVVLAIVGTITWAIMIDSEKGPIVPTPNKTTVIESENTKDSKEASSTDNSDEEIENSSTKEEKKKENFVLESDDGSFVTYKVNKWEKPMKITFKGLDAPAWIGLQAPGTQELFYQYTLQASEDLETFVPDDMDSFSISIGAASNLTIAINGEDIKFNEKTPSIGTKTIFFEQDTNATQSSSTSEEEN